MHCEGNTLIMMVGLPRSGKSTLARQMPYPVVETDAIRFALCGQRWWGPIEHEVWSTARTMIRSLFLAGHKYVVLDATNLTRKNRDRFMCSSDVIWRRVAIVVDTPIDECIRRAKETYPDLVPIIEGLAVQQDHICPSENIESVI